MNKREKPAAQEVPAEQRDETAWLIEKGSLCLGFCEYRFRWVTFTDESALRLCREVDAYALREALKWEPFKMFEQLANTTISEHLWPASAAKPPAEELEAQLEKLARELAGQWRESEPTGKWTMSMIPILKRFIHTHEAARERELQDKFAADCLALHETGKKCATCGREEDLIKSEDKQRALLAAQKERCWRTATGKGK